LPLATRQKPTHSSASFAWFRSSHARHATWVAKKRGAGAPRAAPRPAGAAFARDRGRAAVLVRRAAGGCFARAVTTFPYRASRQLALVKNCRLVARRGPPAPS